MVIMEFAPRGTLLELLVASRCYEIHSPEAKVTSLTMEQMVHFMSDIACGCEFMASIEVKAKPIDMKSHN